MLPASLSIDHVLFVAPDLNAARATLWSRYGLDAVDGGAHTAWGTGNAIVPVGDQYIELFGIVDRDVAVSNPVGRWLLASSREGAGPRAVCLRSADFAAYAAAFDMTIEAGERRYADGRSVSWRQAGVQEAMRTGRPWFLFDWPPESQALRLGTRPPRHERPIAGITLVTLVVPPGAPLDLGPAVLFAKGPRPALRSVTIARTDGSVFDITAADFIGPE